MNGTEWTEPGQGATARELIEAIESSFRSGTGVPSFYIGNAGKKISLRFFGHTESATNLSLTGLPLNLYDVARVGEAR
jgi:hypothetical protein